ncbi:glycosyl transferase family protein [Sphingopyxis indica]|uniref:glycosyl transferase family protein n=1 Tax=Sphingopyxis indica TaxID=436663 RepID=UPI002938F9D2|nr:glycosyl transferase family protein [Sphingopyxis indica]WOF44071.1 glycosyl transferase family protein [Sphingopyxis indica]
MELATEWLAWLVQRVGHELMLFAAVGVLLIGLDDLMLDALWLAMRGRRRAAPRGGSERTPIAGRFAVFVPAWDEAAVLPAMIRRTLAAWEGEDFRLYVGCYPNDAATLIAVSPLVARDPRLRLVVGDADGPTTKGDNLNRLWTALGEDERAEGLRYAAILLHDAEDHVHRGELALFRLELAHHAMVQIPVVPIIERGDRWIGAHYGDEFAEAHGKELVVRSALGVPLPSAGVGCALTRQALTLLAIERGGQPFRADSLTEDYEVGMLIGAYGLRSAFVTATDPDGDPIVSRGEFPARLDCAVRQKARWIAGIALEGWDHLGWLDPIAGGKPVRSWAARWMLWRDRRAPLAALVLLAAYGGAVLAAVALAGETWLGWAPRTESGAMRLLIAFDAALLLWRLGMRGHFTARRYGVRAAPMALPRAFVTNIIAILAARRAVLLYSRMLRSGEVVWDKTDHGATAAPVRPMLAAIRRR